MLEVIHQATGKVLKIYEFWLRDHCRCQECYNTLTKQRKYNVLDLKADVKPLETSYEDKGTIFKVKWSDGHTSAYELDFLFDSQMENTIQRQQASLIRTPWNRSVILQNERHTRVTLTELVQTNEKAIHKLVSSLIRYGIAFVDEVPANTTMTEMAIRRVFPPMKTFFGEMYTFSDQMLDHADTAYTKEYLGSHTDNTYFCDAAGLQALHCIRHENVIGGENFFVDGLHAALELKRRNPHAFEVLSRVYVPAEYIEEGQYHKHSAPMIRTDPITGEIIQLRLNVYDRAAFDTIPQEDMQEFYACFREYLKVVEDMENRWEFKLVPGTIVIFDNWRVYHGRKGYSGLRTMTGCYVQRTDFMSKARVLGIID